MTPPKPIDLSSIDKENEPIPLLASDWLSTSTALLIVYLGFFHCCIGFGEAWYSIIGVVCFSLWIMICVFRQRVFLNRFEMVLHHLVGLDILIEGMNPYHQGYGFYLCALAFWVLFIGYRWWAGRIPRQNSH